MEINTMTMPSNPLTAVAASTAALVAYPCATSAHATTPCVDAQGISVRAWDGVDVVEVADVTATKRERTAADTGRFGFAATTATTLGSPAWSPPN